MTAEVELPVERFFIHGYISDAIASTFLEDFHASDLACPNSIWEIVINSEGGEMAAGTAIFSELRDYSLRCGGTHEVVTIVRGQAASCASLILQAGDWRVAGRMDYIMLHEPLLTMTDAYLSIARDEMQQAEDWTDNMTSVFMERATMRRELFEERLIGHDWWMTAAEAFAAGFIDEIRGEMPVTWVVQK